MAKIDIVGTKKSRKPFTCANCGEVFQPPSHYVFVKFLKDGKWVTGKVCLICDRYG